MINVQPKLQSSAFGAGNIVRTTASSPVRLGPGTNYETLTTLATNVQGTVLSHALRGVLAKGQNWWKCDFGGTVGWVAESTLAYVSGDHPPIIVQHPLSRPVGVGSSILLTVQATGEGTLQYRWQREQADLSDVGSYSGTQSATLSISPTLSQHAGNYRCLVSNFVGTVPSNEARLTVTTPDLDSDLDVDMADFSLLQLCLGLGSASPGCLGADLNADEAVNGIDAAKFVPCVSGQTIPFTPGCLQVP